MPSLPRCHIVPMEAHQVAFLIGEREVLRWNSGTDYPRPYFFPLLSPSGAMLTRMGHPGAPDHDHHQSVWFAHNKVLGIDFWGNASGATIRPLQWFAYEDGDDACRMAVELGWFDGHNPEPLIRQELCCELRPVGDRGEYTLELQSTFVPVAASLELGKTNFGFLAVRVAKSVSAVFGAGVLTGSDSQQKEANLFGRPNTWMDYSGPTRWGSEQIEGITYIDHPKNPGQPTGWHVRDDGWMCASPCMHAAITLTKDTPLTLRYLLYSHRSSVEPSRVAELQTTFGATLPMRVVKSEIPHIRWQIVRLTW